MENKYYITCSLAQSQLLSDNLNYKKIPFSLYVISWSNCRIEIASEHIIDARSIIDGWKEA